MRGKNTKRRTRRLKQRRLKQRRLKQRSIKQRRSLKQRSMQKRSRGQKRSMHKRSMQKRTVRRKYKLRGGQNVPASTPAPVAPAPLPTSAVSLNQPPPPTGNGAIIQNMHNNDVKQAQMARLAGGGSCPEGVPHGKIEVPQFKLTGIDGPINANTNMVDLATTYAIAQTNATNDNLVKV